MQSLRALAVVAAIVASVALVASCARIDMALSSETSRAEVALSELVEEVEQWRWVQTEKVVSLTGPGSSRAVILQNLDQQEMVVSVFLLDVPSAPKLGDDANLRYVLDAEGVVMEHPMARGLCGTAWVSVGDDQNSLASSMVGHVGDLGLDSLQGLEVLRAATATGVPDSDELEMSIPAEFVVSVRAAAEGLLEQVPSAELDVPTVVWRANGIVTVAADATSLYVAGAEATGGTTPADLHARVSWSLRELAGPPDVPNPTDVARADCLG